MAPIGRRFVFPVVVWLLSTAPSAMPYMDGDRPAADVRSWLRTWSVSLSYCPWRGDPRKKVFRGPERPHAWGGRRGAQWGSYFPVLVGGALVSMGVVGRALLQLSGRGDWLTAAQLSRRSELPATSVWRAAAEDARRQGADRAGSCCQITDSLVDDLGRTDRDRRAVLVGWRRGEGALGRAEPERWTDCAAPAASAASRRLRHGDVGGPSMSRKGNHGRRRTGLRSFPSS
jgi:hypothetical protein